MNELIEVIKELVRVQEKPLAEKILKVFGKNPCTSLQFATLGFCYEMVDDKSFAVDLYEKAYRLASAEEETYFVGNKLIPLYIELGQKEKAKMHIDINKKIRTTAELQYWANQVKD